MNLERTDCTLISPHLDDGAWSTGALLWTLAAKGNKPTVVTLCTQEPDSSIPWSALARKLHRLWGLSDEERWSERRREDKEAATILGYEAVHLDLCDGLYRHDDLASLLGGTITDKERAIEVELKEELVRRGVVTKQVERGTLGTEATLLLPLAAGGHADHLLCHRIERNMAKDADLYFYEDLPYAADGDTLTKRLEELERDEQVEPLEVELCQEAVDAHLQAASCYHSQLRSFGGVAALRQILRRALTSPTGGYRLRLWKRKCA